MCYKKLVTHTESHANAVNLHESREQHYIKAINKMPESKAQCVGKGFIYREM